MEKRVRSPNYPALSLPEAVERVGAVYRSMHSHAGPREVVAKAMGYAGLNGASATAVSALHKYGLLDKEGEDVKVSERAMRILHPHSPGERAEAIKEAAYAPALFAELKERFPGSHPNDDLLRNYLVRNQFAPAALTAVISSYRDTSEMVEREVGAHLSLVSHTDERPSEMMNQPNQPPRPQEAHPTAMILGGSLNERSLGRHDYEDGSYVRIAASGQLDSEEALEMIEELIALKRREIARANKKGNAAAAKVVAPAENDEDDGL